MNSRRTIATLTISISLGLLAPTLVYLGTRNKDQGRTQSNDGIHPIPTGTAVPTAQGLVYDPAVFKDVFSFKNWGSTDTSPGWSFATGDFDCDGRLDVVAYRPDGTILIEKNQLANGIPAFIPKRWGSAPVVSGLKLLSGHFIASSRCPDIAYYRPDTGEIFVGRNTGSTFVFGKAWAKVQPASGWQLASGDFNGDGLADIVAYIGGSYGSVWVFEDNGGAVSPSYQGAFNLGSPWAHTQPTDGWASLVVGDFDQIGKTDIAIYHPGYGVVAVGSNSYPTRAFVWGTWATFEHTSGFSLIAGKFAGDGTSDVIAYDSTDGSLNLGRNAVVGFSFTQAPWYRAVQPSAGWTFLPGDFNNDGNMDVLGYYPGDGTNKGVLQVGASSGLPPEGYAWPLSASAGQEVSLYLSGKSDGKIHIVRHRSTQSQSQLAEQNEVATLGYTPKANPIQNGQPWQNGCGWPADTTKIRIGPIQTWPSGIYSARIDGPNGSSFYIPFVVKPAVPSASKIAVLANTNTWLAYNYWGGKAKYQGAAHVTHMRPNPSASPFGDSFQNRHLARGELWILTWLEDNGYTPDVYTDLDFHNGLPSGYRKLVLSTHPEYWTKQMYSNVQAFTTTGKGSLVYLGGNGIFENAEYTSNNTAQMSFLGGMECPDIACHDHVRNYYLFRNTDTGGRYGAAPVGKNEMEVLGVATVVAGIAPQPYTVVASASPVFKNTGLVNGSRIGSTGLNYYCVTDLYSKDPLCTTTTTAAAGWEVDSTKGSACADGFKCQPNPIPVPGHVDGGGPIASAPDSSEMTYYKYPAGNFVFAVGSITFGGSLATDTNLQKILRNVMNLPNLP